MTAVMETMMSRRTSYILLATSALISLHSLFPPRYFQAEDRREMAKRGCILDVEFYQTSFPSRIVGPYSTSARNGSELGGTGNDKYEEAYYSVEFDWGTYAAELVLILGATAGTLVYLRIRDEKLAEEAAAGSSPGPATLEIGQDP